MKKYIIYIFMLIATTFCSCKDEYSDNIMDMAYFGPYEGHKVKIVGFQLEPNNINKFDVTVHLFSYSPFWPQGSFQIRYGYDHVFGPDTLLYSDNPVPSDHQAFASVSYSVDYNDILKPRDTVFVKPYYLIDGGDVVYGEEVVFYMP